MHDGVLLQSTSTLQSAYTTPAREARAHTHTLFFFDETSSAVACCNLLQVPDPAPNMLFSRICQPFAKRFQFRGYRQIAVNAAQTAAKREHVPTYALVIGSCALCFQVAVLYPWHLKLSEQFEELQVIFSHFYVFLSRNRCYFRNQKLTLQIDESSAALEKRMNDLIVYEERLREKETVVLAKEEAIQANSRLILQNVHAMTARYESKVAKKEK